MTNCPTCGQILIINDTIHWDDDCGIVVNNGMLAQFTKTEYEMLLLLRNHRPNVISKDRFMQRLYLLRPDDPPDEKIIDVLICKIRHKLEGMNFNIETAWGRGYRLPYNQEEQIHEQEKHSQIR